jgi:hypothetical protein
VVAEVDRQLAGLAMVNGRHKVGEIIEAVVRHVFRHPGTGDGAVLTVDRIEGPGAEGWWPVSLDCALDSPPTKAGLWAIVWCRTRTDARRAFAERQRALRAAGYETVE